jgi:uncharacterized protein
METAMQAPKPPIESRLDRFISSYVDRLLRWRWQVIAGTVLVVIAAALGAGQLKPKNDYKMWFAPQDPELRAFEALQDQYTRNDNILFVLAPRDGKVFTQQTLAAVEQLTRAGWQLPFAVRVDSVTNFQHSRGAGDDLIVADLVKDAKQFTDKELAQKKAIALAEPLLLNRLIARDASVTGVNVTLHLPLKDPQEEPQAMAAARTLAEQIRAAHPDIELRITGSTALNNAFAEASIYDIGRLVPLMYLVVLATLALMLRSVQATITVTLIIVFSVVAALGIAGWLRMPFTPPMASAPNMIMTLAVAEAIHFFLGLFAELRVGSTKYDAIKRSLQQNGVPMFMTSITTVMGFLSMNSGEAPPLSDMANVVAIGLAVSWLLTVVFVPALAAVLPLRAPSSARERDLGMKTFGDWIVRHARPVLLIGGLACVGLLAMIPRNQLNDEFVKYFSKEITFRQDTDFTLQRLTGVSQIQFSLPAEGADGVSDLKFLQELDAFTLWLRQQPEVVNVASLSDTFKRLNRNLHGDDPAFYRLPEERSLAAQYLLLYELSLPYGLDMRNVLNADKSATQVVVTAGDIDSVQLRSLAARAETWLASNAPQRVAHGSGTAIMFAHISERNIVGMLKGTAIGLLLISAMLIVGLRSVKLGLLSLVPNLLPIAMAFGLWGVLVGQVNLAAAGVAALTFGIVVDDTIHFLGRYLRARRQHGMTPEDAIRHSFRDAGKAVLTTSIILIAGFLVLAFSSFGLNATSAKLTTIVLVLGLIGDFFLLPPLLLLIDRDKPTRIAPVTETANAQSAFD